ncbi:hypothetical protein HK104_002098 [Borealophlyctis nickersoniae]|nr:hypothetical protein HK104_002098 [Borealophlyctis nickersoniae]
MNEDLAALLARAEAFSSNVCEFPTEHNRLQKLTTDSPALQSLAVQHARSARILVHPSLPSLITDFLRYKLSHGTEKEKSIYANMSWQDFVRRCIEKRPLMFVTGNDVTLLRNQQRTSGAEWKKVGTAQEGKIRMEEYLTYDEMAISALLGVSAPTMFINRGGRYNSGNPDAPGSYEPTGIYVGLVGARYEVPNFMEWAHTVISQSSPTGPLDEIWARFYNQKPTGESSFRFPTFTEVATNPQPQRYPRLNSNSFFNAEVYKLRIRIPIEMLLLDANNRAQQENRKAYVHVVGLGLGVWQILSVQEALFIEVVGEALQQLSLPHIGVVDFSWVSDSIRQCGGTPHGSVMQTAKGNRIEIRFSRRDPAEKLKGDDAGMLLVASFAWDGNSFVGNEYWAGSLTASGDPAAVSCSTIGEILNPVVNPVLLENLWVPET